MGIAGLWENWMGVEGSEMESAVIITTAANLEISKIHKRSPVIIGPKDYERWLDCIDGTPANALPLLEPAKAGSFTLQKVSTKVNSPANNGPELLQPVGQQELIF